MCTLTLLEHIVEISKKHSISLGCYRIFWSKLPDTDDVEKYSAFDNDVVTIRNEARVCCYLLQVILWSWYGSSFRLSLNPSCNNI